jgi:hypothetical protein
MHTQTSCHKFIPVSSCGDNNKCKYAKLRTDPSDTRFSKPVPWKTTQCMVFSEASWLVGRESRCRWVRGIPLTCSVEVAEVSCIVSVSMLLPTYCCRLPLHSKRYLVTVMAAVWDSTPLRNSGEARWVHNNGVNGQMVHHDLSMIHAHALKMGPCIRWYHSCYGAP